MDVKIDGLLISLKESIKKKSCTITSSEGTIVRRREGDGDGGGSKGWL